MTAVLDSSVWVALFLNFDTHHTKAERIFSRLKGKVYVPYCVLNEVATVLTYKHSKEQADRFLAFFARNRDVILLDDTFSEEANFFMSLKTRVSFTDAALLLFSKKLKTKLVTFDKQLALLSR